MCNNVSVAYHVVDVPFSYKSAIYVCLKDNSNKTIWSSASVLRFSSGTQMFHLRCHQQETQQFPRVGRIECK